MKNINQIIASLNVARSNNCSKEKSEEFKSIIKDLLPYGNIEEKLGIDLITFVKILTEDVYVKQGNKITKVFTPPILLEFEKEYYFEWHYHKLNNCCEQYKVSEYGKMFALTREELL